MNLDYIKKINGTYGKSCRQSFIDEMLNQYEVANKSVITEFDVLINSSKAKNVLIDGIATKVLMEYKNNKNSNDSNFVWEVRNYPNELNMGNYILYQNEISGEEEYYICTSMPMNKRGYDVNYVQHCNQRFKVSENIEIPCIAANEGFGVKLTSSNEFISESDTKIKVTLQSNEITRNIPLNTRFILSNSMHGVYKVSDVAVYKTGMLVFTCKKDTFKEGYDDLINGIAYNGDLDLPSEETPIEYEIEGKDSIRKGQTEAYTINEANGEWQVEDYSGAIEIVNQDNNSITIKCLSYGDYITLNYIVDNVVATKDISLVR